MGEGQAGQVAPVCRKASQGIDNIGQVSDQDIHRFAHQQQVSVAPDELTGGAEVDDRTSRRGRVAKGMDVSDDVVPELALVLGRRREIDVFEVIGHFL